MSADGRAKAGRPVHSRAPASASPKSAPICREINERQPVIVAGGPAERSAPPLGRLNGRANKFAYVITIMTSVQPSGRRRQSSPVHSYFTDCQTSINEPDNGPNGPNESEPASARAFKWIHL